MSFAVVILAAGQGTRMKSKLPKVLHKIIDVPMVQLVVESAREAGATQIVVITGHQAELVEQQFADQSDVVCVRQKAQIGTANAVAVARPVLDVSHEHVVVLSGDTPLMKAATVQSLVETCRAQSAAMTVLTAIQPNPFGYGRIVRGETDEISRIVEQKDADERESLINEVNTGTYCFNQNKLFAILPQIKNENAAGEYYLTDTVALFCQESDIVCAVCADDADETLGVNSRSQLAYATSVLQNRINTYWMDEGVTLLDPNSVWISPHATLERDVEVLPNSFILGTSNISEDAIVGPSSRVVDSAIGASASVDSSIVLSSTVGERACVGPRAYIRPNCTVEAGAKVGTSVEIKNTHIGLGSKVPHLSYIGDAAIGAQTNIGAGTITCNYDGVTKSQTIIGDNVFIGSDTMLVAPVTIESEATVGAGSVITKDVPAQSLAIERTEQRIIDGWSVRKRKGNK